MSNIVIHLSVIHVLGADNSFWVKLSRSLLDILSTKRLFLGDPEVRNCVFAYLLPACLPTHPNPKVVLICKCKCKLLDDPLGNNPTVTNCDFLWPTWGCLIILEVHHIMGPQVLAGSERFPQSITTARRDTEHGCGWPSQPHVMSNAFSDWLGCRCSKVKAKKAYQSFTAVKGEATFQCFCCVFGIQTQPSSCMEGNMGRCGPIYTRKYSIYKYLKGCKSCTFMSR